MFASSEIKASSDSFDSLIRSAFVARFTVSIITRMMRATHDVLMDCMLRLILEPDTGIERQKANGFGCCLGSM